MLSESTNGNSPYAPSSTTLSFFPGRVSPEIPACLGYPTHALRIHTLHHVPTLFFSRLFFSCTLTSSSWLWLPRLVLLITGMPDGWGWTCGKLQLGGGRLTPTPSHSYSNFNLVANSINHWTARLGPSGPGRDFVVVWVASEPGSSSRLFS